MSVKATKSWSDELIAKTREVLSLDFVPFDDSVHLKNVHGGYGKILIGDLLASRLRVQIKDKSGVGEAVFAGIDELIAAGWAVD